MTRLRQLSFDNCEIGEIDARAFDAGKDSGPLEVTFMYSTFDDDALFDRVRQVDLVPASDERMSVGLSRCGTEHAAPQRSLAELCARRRERHNS